MHSTRAPLAHPAVALSSAIFALSSAFVTTACANGVVKSRQPIPASNVFSMPDRAVCATSIEEPTEVGTLESDQLVEISGLAMSPTHQGVLWGHNDHGDSARVFAISSTGKDLGQVALPNITNVDFEDIDAAVCPDLSGPCIYVSDTGDNNLDRPNLFVYAFPEPQNVDATHPLPANSEAAIVFRFPIALPDGPANIEAVAIAPDASAMYFYEKAPTHARIFKYAAPWNAEALTTIEDVGTFDPPASTFLGGDLPTGADFHTSGTRVALRTYGAAYEIKIDAANGVTPDHFGVDDLVKLFDGPASEPQGEAIAYDDDGTGLFLVSESPDKTPHQALHHASCAPAP